MKSTETAIDSGYNPYQLLRVYTYYRVVLGSLLLLVFESNLVTNVLGSESRAVFVYACWLYLGLGIISLISLWRRHSQPSQRECGFAVMTDIAAIIILMYASGGTTSGLGYLLIVAVAAAGMLMSAQLAVFMAALATIGLIVESIIHHLVSGIDTKALFASGSLGALIFITAITFQYITRKIRSNAQQLQAQMAHVAHLQKLARLIVERMRTGIVVLNQHDEIELINNAAQTLLELRGNSRVKLTLKNVPDIQRALHNWRSQGGNRTSFSSLANRDGPSKELRISLANLELGKNEDTLVFVEDNRAIAQQAQQLKLASLGRLTASIAHEIRNPLGAISHAGQLLSESPGLSSDDQRLLEIIDSHTRRVNQIIENILHVSRRKATEPETIDLAEWAEQFAAEYNDRHSQPAGLATRIEQRPVMAQFDPGQLHQIVNNLVENGLRYADKSTGEPAITLEVGVEPARQSPYLNIVDNGPGITPEQQRHVFEPFFTTESTGSGLGLFICKELCEANQAFINYRCDKNQPSCFTIQFAHPHKAQT